MQDFEVKRLQMFIKVTEFFKTYGDNFQSPFSKEQFAEVENVVKDLNQNSSAQVSGNKTAQQNSTVKAVLRNELREDMALISRMARAIALFKPGLEDKFRMPRPGNDQLLLSTARSFAENASPFVNEFVKREMPADFLERLQANIDLFENAVREKMQGKSVQVTASAAIDDSIERGMNAVRQLDPIVRVKFEDNPAALAAWFSASHTERVPRSAAQPQPSTQPPSVPQS